MSIEDFLLCAYHLSAMAIPSRMGYPNPGIRLMTKDGGSAERKEKETMIIKEPGIEA